MAGRPIGYPSPEAVRLADILEKRAIGMTDGDSVEGLTIVLSQSLESAGYPVRPDVVKAIVGAVSGLLHAEFLAISRELKK
jgi:hypothetical protein